MAQQEERRFHVQIYNVTMQHNTYYYDNLQLAKKFARLQFVAKPGVYKVKIWDLEKGPIEPNRHNAAGLVYELL